MIAAAEAAANASVQAPYAVFIAFSVGAILGALLLHLKGSVREAEAQQTGFHEGFRASGSNHDAHLRSIDSFQASERKVWQDRVDDLKQIINPGKTPGAGKSGRGK